MNYFIASPGGAQQGPFTVEELRGMALTGDKLVWKEGMSEWTQARNVPELKGILVDQGMPDIPGARPQATSYGHSLESIYTPNFDLRQLSDQQRAEFRQHQIRSHFPVGLAIFLHFITLGLFSLIKAGLYFDALPKIKSDDFGAGRGIGFMFIPFFNIYWLFVFWPRLTRQINLQYRLRGMTPPLAEGLPIAYGVVRLIPYINLFAYLILMPILYGNVQSAANRLAKLSAEENAAHYSMA